MYDVAKRDALVSQFYRAGGDAQALTHALLSAYRLGLEDGREVSATSPAPVYWQDALPPWGWLDERLVEAVKAAAKVAAPPLRPPVYGAQEEADHKAAVSAPQGEIKPAAPPAWEVRRLYEVGDRVTYGSGPTAAYGPPVRPALRAATPSPCLTFGSASDAGPPD